MLRSAEEIPTMETNSKMVLERIFRADPGADLTQNQRTELFRAMSPRCLVDSFLDSDVIQFGDEHVALQLESLRETFHLLDGNVKLLEQVADVIFAHLKELRSEICGKSGSDLLRVVLILLECPSFDWPDKEWSHRIIIELAHLLILMHETVQKNFDKLVCWWGKDSDLLGRVVKIYMQSFKNLLKNSMNNSVLIPKEDPHILILWLLNEADKSNGYKLPVSHFYIRQFEDEETCKKIETNVLQLLLDELDFPGRPIISLANMPFLLDVPLKWKHLCLRLDHFCAQNCEQVEFQLRIRFAQAFGVTSALFLLPIMLALANVPVHVKIFGRGRLCLLKFEIENDREKIVESAISNIIGKAETSLLLPLIVHFKADVALGAKAGGPMKEFFSRLFEELFNLKKHSIFKKLDDTPSCVTYWFNKDYKDLDKVKSIGKLFALMFYNKVIVTMPFPLIFYKKLLEKSKSNLEDLKWLDPAMAQSMEGLLTMSDDELSCFTFSVDGPEGEPEIELKPGGKEEIVTTSNVREYIELYAKHYTANSHFDAFSESFKSIFSRFQLDKHFTPQELMSLFQGGKYDWKSFQESFGYDMYDQHGAKTIGYTADHRVIKMFWSVFQDDLNESQKKDLLRFMTGADHVPLGGFREIGPRIWPMGGDKDCRGKPPENMCPEMNTCHGYVVLHLPMYKTREHLRERLLKLLEMKGQGFHKLVTQ